ncbi:hypothetical protein RND81_13G219600 [Saponaria officinalis]|uniref:Rhodanese domain-containing protein n=1 Tax=Saponaria officinalis TaxID=3572 RepID=A0AAW1H0U5_SAPOF
MAVAALNYVSQSPSSFLWSYEAIRGNLSRFSVSAITFKNTSRACIGIGCRFTFTAPRRSESRRQFVWPTPTSVPVRVAHELVQAGHHFLDIRSPQEFSAGHVQGAVNVPFLLTLPASGMFMNPHFVPHVSSLFRKDDEILIGCQTGNLSLMALHQLLSAGFIGVLDTAGGYDAWIQGELPTQL